MMKIFKFLIVAALAIATPNALWAQHISADSTWTFGGNLSISLNQISQTNWAAGGENAVGVNTQLDYSAVYKKDIHLWDNKLELAYGLNDTETNGTRKTNDKIYLNSTYGREIAKNLYFSGTLGFQSQFAQGYKYESDGSDYLISDFMAPGYLTAGLGLTWTPKKWLTATFTPATYRGIFVESEMLSDQGQFGVDAGEHYKTEFGAKLNLEGAHDIMKNVNLASRLSLFSDYMGVAKNVDVEWQVKLSMTVNKWLSANITTNLIYDDNVKITDSDGNTGARLQFQEIIGVGLSVKM